MEDQDGELMPNNNDAQVDKSQGLIKNVALIGSFRQYYKAVLESLAAFADVGLVTTTPKGTPIVEPGIPFVRFESDETDWTDEMVQVAALHRILRADFVFVVVPEGYVGRTTCYEIGRVVQAGRPIYFSQRPDDLPLFIPDSNIKTAKEIAKEIRTKNFEPSALHTHESSELGRLERDLLDGQYADI